MVPGISSCPNKEAIIYKQVCYQVPGISSCQTKSQLYINRYAIRSQGFLLVQRGNYISILVPGISSCPKSQLYINRYAIRSQGFLLVQTKMQLYINRYAIRSQGFLLVPKAIRSQISPCPNKEAIIYKQVCYQVPGISSCLKRQLYINRYAIRSQGFLLSKGQLYINRYAIRSQGFLLVLRVNYI